MPTADQPANDGVPGLRGTLHLRHLPAYARYLLDHHLEAFSTALLRISRELRIPLLRYFEGMADAQLIALGMEGNQKLLGAIADNRATEYIEDNLRSWKENQLPLIQGDDIVIEDISRVNFSRRKAFRDFLQWYSTDLATCTGIMEEVDAIILRQEDSAYKTLFEIKEQKIRAHAGELEHREMQLQEAQEISGVGSFDWDLAGGHSRYSPQLLKIFELESRSSLPDFMAYIHPADRAHVSEALAAAVRDGGIYECEYRYRKNGPEKIIWSRGKVVYDEAGKAMRMRGTVMDVTLRHDMLRQLERSEQLSKQAQALTHIGNWSWMIAGDKVEWSDEMYRIFGLEPQSEQITLGRILGMLHPEDRAPRHAALHDAIHTARAEDYTMRVLHPGGVRVIEGKTEVLLDEEGRPYKLAGTCQDITKQHQLNELLRENEEASRQLIANAPGAIVVIDDASDILLWNPMAEETFGWTPDEILGRKLMDTIIPHTYRGLHQAGMKRLHTTGESRVLNKTIEITALKKSGAEFYISLTISRSQRGGKPAFIAFIRDISQEKAAAQQVIEQRNQLAQKARELERSNGELMSFNYIASHDLQEPVRKIRIFSNLILSDDTAPLPGRTADLAGRIATAANHMHRLIEALIAFSRTGTGDRMLEPVNLNDVIAEVRSMLSEKTEELGAVITAEALPRLNAVPFQMQQLFENIIGNALKYRKPDVAPLIRITATVVLGNEIGDPAADAGADYHRISVADNGIGFEQRYAAKVFDLFQRLHNRNDYSGTGIGLAICKKIVQHHEGFIAATSAVGRGTRFDIYLPLNAPE